MIDNYLNELTPKLEKALNHLETELSTIHTGRAQASLLDGVSVEVYGQRQPVKAIASISIPEPRQIVIQPWDKSIASQIEGAIRDSDLGLNPVNAGDVIRINIPELTTERRQQFVKMAKEMTEEARIAVRNARQDVLNEAKKAKNSSEISEDELHRAETEVQKFVEKYNKSIDDIFHAKEKELTQI